MGLVQFFCKPSPLLGCIYYMYCVCKKECTIYICILYFAEGVKVILLLLDLIQDINNYLKYVQKRCFGLTRFMNKNSELHDQNVKKFTIRKKSF